MNHVSPRYNASNTSTRGHNTIPNALYYGDNLDILRRHIPDESVDLIYLDPPFKSQANYNLLYKDQAGERSPAQIKAFEDTWTWDENARRAYEQLVTDPRVPSETKELLGSLERFMRRSDMWAHLVMMAARIVELNRVLKTGGSLYLHCDSTASHYLKLLLDTILGPRNFRNEIIWKRQTAHSDSAQGSKHYGRLHDSILFYGKGEPKTWNQQYVGYDQKYMDSFYRHVEPETGRRFRLSDITGPGGAAKGNPQYEFLGVTRYWRFSKEKMIELHQQGRVVQTRPGAVPQQKRYLDEMPGMPVQSMWTDILPVQAQGRERLGYPTQKPEALLERIIQTSSNPGDVVLDPFCGCGTAVVAAHRLGRQWIGIDLTYLAIAVMESRLRDTFAPEPGVDYAVLGIPRDLDAARALAAQDAFQFQYWAVGLVAGQPVGATAGSSSSSRRGADRGIDGLLYWIDERGKQERAVLQVKSGHVSSAHIRHLSGVLEREKTALGLFITLEPPARDMRQEAASAGTWHSALWQRDYPRIQLRTIEDLLEGRRFDLPPSLPPHAQAARAAEAAQQMRLGG